MRLWLCSIPITKQKASNSNVTTEFSWQRLTQKLPIKLKQFKHSAISVCRPQPLVPKPAAEGQSPREKPGTLHHASSSPTSTAASYALRTASSASVSSPRLHCWQATLVSKFFIVWKGDSKVSLKTASSYRNNYSILSTCWVSIDLRGMQGY